MNEIALAHTIELSKVRFTDDDTQFVLDWIIAHDKEEQLARYLCDCERHESMDTHRDEYNEDRPLWTERSLERLLRGFDPDSGDPYLGNFELTMFNERLLKHLGVPEPSMRQYARHILPSEWCRGSGTSMRSPTMRPLRNEDIERTVIYHLGKGVISIDIQSAYKPDAE